MVSPTTLDQLVPAGQHIASVPAVSHVQHEINKTLDAINAAYAKRNFSIQDGSGGTGTFFSKTPIFVTTDPTQPALVGKQAYSAWANAMLQTYPSVLVFHDTTPASETFTQTSERTATIDVNVKVTGLTTPSNPNAPAIPDSVTRTRLLLVKEGGHWLVTNVYPLPAAPPT